MHYTEFGVCSSSSIPFRARTHTQTRGQTDKVTDATDHLIPLIGYRQLEMTRNPSHLGTAASPQLTAEND